MLLFIFYGIIRTVYTLSRGLLFCHYHLPSINRNVRLSLPGTAIFLSMKNRALIALSVSFSTR